ncbi:MAG: hypothetical protein ACRDS0_15860 [Pseudonocardiaceae bacterium]
MPSPGTGDRPGRQVYAASNGGVLHDLDPATGANRWTYDSGHTGGGDLSVPPLVLPDRTVLWPTPGTCMLPSIPTQPCPRTQR